MLQCCPLDHVWFASQELTAQCDNLRDPRKTIYAGLVAAKIPDFNST
jgi:hypothetical protein